MSNIMLVGANDSTPMDIEISKNISEILVKQYPGYLWAVSFSSFTGIGHVRCLNLSGEYGFVFKDSDISADPSYKIPVRGAGEILERFKMRRGNINFDEVLDMKCVGGRPIFDYHESKNCKIPAIIKLAYDKLG